MSFILDALKKSEQERQQQCESSQPQQKRTISLSSQASRSRFWVFLLGGIILLLIAGFLFSGLNATLKKETSTEQSILVDDGLHQKPKSENVPVKSELSSEDKEKYVLSEPAPVPRYFIQEPPTTNGKSLELSGSSASQHQQPRLMMKDGGSVHNERQIEKFQSQHPEGQYPLYEELSAEVRSRMPLLEMSMHFYTETPSKRLTRINNNLYHEGDWISDDLQIVEIIPSGVVLDFVGLSFELPGLSR